MEVYYTKQEYNDMKKSLEKQLKLANKTIKKLEDKIKDLKKKHVTE